MDQLWIKFLIEFSWLLDGLASALIFYLVLRLLRYGYQEHRHLYNFEDREQTIETWVKFLRPIARQIHWRAYLQWIKIKKSQSAFMPSWDSHDFIAYQILLGGLAFLLSYLLICVLFGASITVAIGACAAVFIYPLISIADVAAKRQNSCYKDLPYVIDYLCLAMGAGLDFKQSLARVLEDAPPSPLTAEFSLALKNMKLGMSRAEALNAMDQRMDNPSLRLFLQTLIQAMELGTDVAQALLALSDTFRTKRFQYAEELAGKISVRMMIPMLIFILPAVMIMLLGPMLLSSQLSF